MISERTETRSLATYGVLALVNLVTSSVLCGLSTGAEACVRVLCDVLVGFLGGTGGHLVGLVTDV